MTTPPILINHLPLAGGSNKSRPAGEDFFGEGSNTTETALPPVIVGIGLAGLSVALTLAPGPVILMGRKSANSLTSSEMAQGGIAAAMGKDDAPERHAQDTLAAGAGHCDPAIVTLITNEAPAAIERLTAWGVPFDRDKAGALKLGLEGAHSRRRIVHAKGDSTGAYIMKALMAQARKTPSITILEDCEAQDILQDDTGAVMGLSYYNHATQETVTLETRDVILATGGAGALWQNATVPSASWGHGLLLAARVGAALKDLEFMQFHPTGLDTGRDPMPLISEALRGEGAFLVNDKGVSFVDALAPRDVVSRAIWAQIESGHRCFLDARHIPNFAARFPTVADICRQNGIDPTTQKIPVRPTAHYHMGGIATDKNGATNVRGLWACGECACTGLHGANRLASNSLLEAAVMGARVGQALKKQPRNVIPATVFAVLRRVKRPQSRRSLLRRRKAGIQRTGERTIVYAALDSRSARSVTDAALVGNDILFNKIRTLMTTHVGLTRDARGLATAIDELVPLASQSPQAQVALLIARAALARTKSLGAHSRSDGERPSETNSSELKTPSVRENEKMNIYPLPPCGGGHENVGLWQSFCDAISPRFHRWGATLFLSSHQTTPLSGQRAPHLQNLRRYDVTPRFCFLPRKGGGHA